MSRIFVGSAYMGLCGFTLPIALLFLLREQREEFLMEDRVILFNLERAEFRHVLTPLVDGGLAKGWFPQRPDGAYRSTYSD